MNVRVPVSKREAAEGLPRRRFSVAEVERMVACGILLEDERIELVGGDLVPMPAKGIRHEVLKRALLRHWALLLGEGIEPLVETTLRLSDDAYVEPDLLLVPTDMPLDGLRASDCLLAVEIADGSLAFDLDVKPALYAAAGLPELWVVDARSLATVVFGRDGDQRFVRRARLTSRKAMIPSLAPRAAVTLAALTLL